MTVRAMSLGTCAVHGENSLFHYQRCVCCNPVPEPKAAVVRPSMAKQRRIERAMQTLTDKERAVVDLYGRGVRPVEIGPAAGLTDATVMSMIRTASAKLGLYDRLALRQYMRMRNC
jgi:DNA-binding NarL/FixJ family response regulator